MAEIWVNSKIRCWSDEAKRKRDESIENPNLSLSLLTALLLYSAIKVKL
jgi:hypothetical protein